MVASVLFPLGTVLATVTNPFTDSYLVHRHFRSILDVRDETSLSTWASVSVMLLVGVTCLLLYKTQKRRGWLLPGLLFLFLSADDATLIHERVGKVVHPHIGDSGVYTWLLAMGPLLAILGVSTLLVLFRAFRDRPRAFRDVVLGFGLMATALMIEAFEQYIETEGLMLFGETGLSALTKLVEEWIELLGPLFVLRAVASELELEFRGRAEAHPNPEVTE